VSKKIYIDKDECTGCELCVDRLPQLFKINTDGISEVIATVENVDLIALQDVIDNCPAECIHYEK